MNEATMARYTYKSDDTVMTYAVETYDEIIEDIKPLLIAHHEELAAYPDIALDPDYEFYRKADAIGLLKIFSARLNGKLIGYAIYVARDTHAHYKQTPWAVSDIVLIVKEHRNYGVGTGLFDFIEDHFKGYVVQTNCKLSHPELGALLAARHHDRIGETYSIRL